MADFGFIGGSYTDSTVNVDAQRSMNVYPEADESGHGKGRAKLVGTPGLLAFGSALPTSPIRCILAAGSRLNSQSRLFVVAGAILYEVSSTGTIISTRGNVGNDGQPAQMFVNGNQLMIVSAGIAYIDNGVTLAQASFVAARGTLFVSATGSGISQLVWISGDVFSGTYVGQTLTIGGSPFVVQSVQDPLQLTVTGNVLPAGGTLTYTANVAVTARSGAFLDHYFIVHVPGTKQFNISALDDGTSWNGLDVGVKESDAYNIGRVFVDHQDLWLFGEEQSEVWKNTGRATFPLERQVTIAQGIAAPWSPVPLMNGVAWLALDSRGGPMAVLAQGFQPKRISTFAIESAWRGYTTVADSIGFAYRENGHEFWQISFPTANATWVYDATTNFWHERGWWNGAANTQHRANCHAYQFGAHIVGDYSTGQLYKMGLVYLDDAGTAINRERTAPHTATENKWIQIQRLTLDMETGLGASPVVTLELSRDGGHTYGAVHSLTAGVLGDYKARVVYRRLGRARDFVARVRTAATTKVTFVGAYVDIGKTTGV